MPPRPSPPRLTHFLCLPLVTSTSRPQLQTSLSTFRDAVTSTRTRELPDGIPEEAVRPLGTLHLTLGVMSLLTQERIDAALKVLREVDLAGLLGGEGVQRRGEEGGERGKEAEKEKGKGSSGSANAIKPINLTLQGLSSMHDPTQTSVLYAPPLDPTQRLSTFAQALRASFLAADLLIADTRPLLLHATIVNTVYVPGVRSKGPGGHGKHKAKLTLDTSALLEDYEGFVWMEDVRLEKVAICRMGARANEDGEEEYVVEGEVEMPA